MELSAPAAIQLMTHLVGVSVIVQSLEFIVLRREYWPWEIVRRDYLFLPQPVVAILDVCLSDQIFLPLNVSRFAVAVLVMVFPAPFLLAYLFLTTVLICLRYRGTFNGGSDFMTLITLLATTVCWAFPHPAVLFVCLWYVAIQSCSSYFIGGFIKLKRANWRNGSALSGFVGSTIYKEAGLTTLIRSHRALAIFAAWIAMLFEVALPLLVFLTPNPLPALAAAAGFHVTNAYLFGLNRFTFAWVASYPAILFASQSLRQF